MKGRQKGTMLRVGHRNAYESDFSVNKNQLIKDGIYCSPHFHTCVTGYAQPININVKNYRLIFQCRVNPKKVHICPGQEDYWVINEPEDIRPYGIILIKE